MTTYQKRNLHGHVTEQLGRNIVSGRWKPGTIIDVEKLEDDLQVSRTVVREAIKVLTSKGLVDARPKYGTYVRPRRDWNLLDADVMSWRDNGRPDAHMLRDLDEVRRAVDPVGARLAAERRTSQDIRELEQALDELADASRSGDTERHVAADVRFHRGVLAASKNELLERLEQLLEPALRRRDMFAFTPRTAEKLIAQHAAVLDAIRAGDGDRAQQTAEALIDSAAADTAALLPKRPKSGSSTRPSGRPQQARG